MKNTDEAQRIFDLTENLPFKRDIEVLHWTKYRKNYRHFILSTIEAEELAERGLPDTDAGRIDYIISRLESETGKEILGRHIILTPLDIIEQWLSGLALNIPFEYWEILELAEACGSCRYDMTDRQNEKIVDNYFNFMANQVALMINQHKFSTVIS
jgi:hypothetical protein